MILPEIDNFVRRVDLLLDNPVFIVDYLEDIIRTCLSVTAGVLRVFAHPPVLIVKYVALSRVITGSAVRLIQLPGSDYPRFLIGIFLERKLIPLRVLARDNIGLFIRDNVIIQVVLKRFLNDLFAGSRICLFFVIPIEIILFYPSVPILFVKLRKPYLFGLYQIPVLVRLPVPLPLRGKYPLEITRIPVFLVISKIRPFEIIPFGKVIQGIFTGRSFHFVYFLFPSFTLISGHVVMFQIRRIFRALIPAKIRVCLKKLSLFAVNINSGRFNAPFGLAIGFKFVTLGKIHYFFILFTLVISHAVKQKAADIPIFIAFFESLRPYERVFPESFIRPARFISGFTALEPGKAPVKITHGALYGAVVPEVQRKIRYLIPVQAAVSGLGQDPGVIRIPGLGF